MTASTRRLVALAGMAWLMTSAVLAHAAPNLSNDFGAEITVTRLDFKPRGVPQRYSWTEWQGGKLSRFHVFDEGGVLTKRVFRYPPDNALTMCNGGPFVVPLPGKKGKEYTWDLTKVKCKKKGIPKKDLRPLPRIDPNGFFAFASQASIAGSCASRTGNNVGTLWAYQLPESKLHKFTRVSVCVASHNSTPYWVAFDGPSRQCATSPCEIVGVVFLTYSPVVPAAAQFCPDAAIAAACKVP